MHATKSSSRLRSCHICQPENANYWITLNNKIQDYAACFAYQPRPPSAALRQGQTLPVAVPGNRYHPESPRPSTGENVCTCMNWMWKDMNVAFVHQNLQKFPSLSKECNEILTSISLSQRRRSCFLFCPSQVGLKDSSEVKQSLNVPLPQIAVSKSSPSIVRRQSKPRLPIWKVCCFRSKFAKTFWEQSLSSFMHAVVASWEHASDIWHRFYWLPGASSRLPGIDMTFTKQVQHEGFLYEGFLSPIKIGKKSKGPFPCSKFLQGKLSHSKNRAGVLGGEGQTWFQVIIIKEVSSQEHTLGQPLFS